ncbi:hypothetical protein H112_07597 [Trichophyton rubrum D6]|uniref:AT DNA binding protein n=2 Tax=Trichophyton rubrum TaxID=5551 RepID=F2SEC0_TRIRC|nr:uncharacterized protein TERG_00198 [Trichophyton rubrum CBS 118892]EZF11309.1 hypothetical protein H100_07624 [Trichophyton rubrum MR850]EZF38236.1 hypothetical protein H102_07588 [Trichophyton rubrum CBS 100081]EZF48788.1 hypothetical protein H103_07610 [Trichophyton rubrum CBS 288.86]EZF59377.1 hypothetical protein H104_07559 [Trichophyton rubrum CBS 289.86]EZF80710.1 hypothetical protein H110_07607 [Trichophyton rubrum MR1448]EZF91389.1 hypothetical protein H113_07665 [Trichophyton rubr
MASRSSTSSPDPLGYPGDPEYLLSSAKKPFSQRIMSPQKRGTPRRGRPPLHQKSYQSPKKSVKKNGQTIRLEDIILPSTPSGNSRATRFDRRSLSPTKAILQSDGNISPWRIRVTVEAEQEDEEEGGQAMKQKRLGPWVDGKTVKVPLKGTSSTEPTPKRRRRRKSRTDITERPPTPGPKKGDMPTEAASATIEKGQMTGVQENTEAVEDVISSVEDNALPQDLDEPTQGFGDVFLDLAADGDTDDGDDGGSDALMGDHVEMNAGPRQPSTNETGITPLDRRKDLMSLENSKVSSIRTALSPINVTNAGRTPRPKRIYPTPTSSSLIDETLEKPANHVAETDPTDEHREFDSIMESEGFSMVSLNTLPSARQRLRQIVENQASRTRTPKSHATPRALQQISPKPTSTTALSPNISATQSSSKRPHSQLYEAISSLQQSSPRDMTSRLHRTPRLNNPRSVTRPPPAPAAAPEIIPPKRRPLAQLCRVIRAGIALHGLLDRRRQSSNLQTPFSSPNTDSADDMAATRRRLDHLFQDFNMETRRELRAGVRFGEELVKRLRQPNGKRRELSVTRESTRLQEITSMRPSQNVVYSELGGASQGFQPATVPAPENREEEIKDDPRQEPYPAEENPEDASMDSLMARREAEWRREREAISRQIEMANESQVIVIDSDDGLRQPAARPGVMDNHKENNPQQRNERDLVNSQDDTENEKEDEVEEVYDGDETDIWQQAAREPEARIDSPSLSDTARKELPQHRKLGFPSPRAGTEEEAYSATDDYESVALPDLSAGGDAFPKLAVGKSKMDQYRDTDASLSPLLGTPDSATIRFYEGNFKRSSVGNSQHHHSQEMLESLPRRNNRSFDEPAGSQNSHPKGDQEKSMPGEDGGVIDNPLNTLPEGQSSITPVPLRNQDEVLQGANIVQEEALSESDVYVEVHEEEGSENDPAESDITNPSIPDPPEQTSTVTWFNKLTSNLAPAWLTSTPAPTKSSKQRPTVRVKQDVGSISNSEIAVPATQPSARSQDWGRTKGKIPDRHSFVKPLAISGYFTDDHYVELREIYREAKMRPEKFKYYPTDERDEMVGQWMWSADGQHRRQVTEIQLMIVERFRQNLIEDDLRHGGDGEMEWSEEDILWRLFSIIVGEQIRKQRKEQQQRLQLHH